MIEAVRPAVVPDVVLVHGTWGNPDDWFRVREVLERAGLTVHAPDLPSHHDPVHGLLEDADHVRRFVETLAAPVVLVGWSYGGDVIGLAAAAPTPVAHLVYLTAVPRASGSSGLGVEWAESLPQILLDPRGTHVLDNRWWLEEEVGATFPEPVREHLFAHPRRAVSVRIDTDVPWGRQGWQDVPTTVLLGREDPLISVVEMDLAVARSTDVRVVDGDHFLIWRAPELVAAVVTEAVRTQS